MLLVINSEPTKTEHVSWFTRNNAGDKIDLHEVVREFHPDPQSPKHTMVQVITTAYRDSADRFSQKAAAWILLEASMKVIGNADAT